MVFKDWQTEMAYKHRIIKCDSCMQSMYQRQLHYHQKNKCSYRSIDPLKKKKPGRKPTKYIDPENMPMSFIQNNSFIDFRIYLTNNKCFPLNNTLLVHSKHTSNREHMNLDKSNNQLITSEEIVVPLDSISLIPTYDTILPTLDTTQLETQQENTTTSDLTSHMQVDDLTINDIETCPLVWNTLLPSRDLGHNKALDIAINSNRVDFVTKVNLYFVNQGFYFYAINTKGDGHCFYRSIAHKIKGNEKFYNDIKKTLLKNVDLLTGTECEQFNPDVVTDVSANLTSKVDFYADSVEYLIVLCTKVFKMNFVVFMWDKNSNHIYRINRQVYEDTTTETIYILHNGEDADSSIGHYLAVEELAEV